MNFTIITLFPDMFVGPFDHSIIKIAKEKGLVDVHFVNIRDFGIGRHKTVDDTPYGGGQGMVLRVDVLAKAIEYTKKNIPDEKVILLGAQGQVFNQTKAKELARIAHLILICGHYEGVDERVKTLIDEEVSMGNFITTGGEIPAMLITDAVIRLIPDVLKEGVTDSESYSISDNGQILLEYPQYTRPVEFNGEKVPDILQSGNHKEIAKWRLHQARILTKEKRPDLLK